MLYFSYKILNFDNDRIDLKNKLIFNEERKLMYDLRNKDLFFEPGIKSKYGTNTFEYIYSRLINKFDLSFNHFKLSIFNNINLIYAKSLKKFDQDLNCVWLSEEICFSESQRYLNDFGLSYKQIYFILSSIIALFV
ncbi:hypothetical protein BpHYR1_032848 [Brachionus plicatilis]|uniref:Uncharacterized protein n=1 Tax=Brachionus plicatilis TaxID=10195 RepID=A0A3M7Q4Y7_BRAPC|nr:hypothetical protein BpHYR1_032848 [Brachionus plicatilis]